MTDATTAEMVKLMENTFRDVNIALANELATIAERLGVDVWEAIGLANHHPRVKVLRPGPGVGGHCIAVDPWFLVEAAPDQARLIRQARLVNDGMPAHVVELVQRVVEGVREPVIACLGLTYKADVDDVRESPAVEVVEGLIQAGYQVRAFDPYVSAHRGIGDHLVFSLSSALDGADLALLLVDHMPFRRLQPAQLATMRARCMLDTRACLDRVAWEQAGVEMWVLGVGSRHVWGAPHA